MRARVIIGIFGGALALGWAVIASDYFRGVRRVPQLSDLPPFESDGHADDAPPSVSVAVAACNEEAKITGAFRTLLAQDYPGPYEIVAVNDRSTDQTGALLRDLAREGREQGVGVRILTVSELPPGWLGKTHALYQAAHASTGDWILFTDADMRLAPDALSRAVRWGERENLDHVVAFFRLDLSGFWETVFGLCFGTLFKMRFRPWRVRDQRSGAYLGIGGFNLVRRGAYERIGTHRALALEVADDMELGRRLKQAHAVTGVVESGAMVHVRWQEDGLLPLMNGLTKNAYAGLQYSPFVVVSSIGLLLATITVPVLGVFVARPKAGRIAHAVALALFLAIGADNARKSGIARRYALTLPFSVSLLIAVMVRSAFVTERAGGITWRNTFYPLADLRRGAVPLIPPLITEDA